MSVNFERNSYLSAVKEKAHLNDDSKIFNHAKAGLQFTYVDVGVQEFNQKYSAEGWFGRKVVALPSAIWSGIVKTIYHLAKAILVGGIVRSGDSNYLKVQFFYIARDLQESFGWLATLLNDRYGQHHIQESGFHKSCYDCFLSNNMPQPDSPQQGNTDTSYHQGYSSSKTPTHRTAIPLTTPLQNSPQNQTHYRQNEFHSTVKASYLASDSANFTHTGNQPSDKQSVINRMMRDPSGFPSLNYDLKNDEDVVAAALSGCKNDEQAKIVIRNANYNAKNSRKVALAIVKIDPTQFGQLNYDAKNDEDVVAAALSGCKNAEQAKIVIRNANYNAKNSKKVALALVKIDPTQFGQLNYDAKNDEDVVAAALSGCKNAEQAKKVICNANYDAKNSKKVALALVKINPSLLGQLSYNAKNDLQVVLLAIELSTEQTIHKIWSSVGIDAAFNKEVRTKVKEKYPNFFQEQTFNGSFPNFFQHQTFQGFPSSNTQNTSKQTPQDKAPIKWPEPDDLKGNTSDEANIVRRILNQNHLLAIDLTRTDVSKEIAKGILCQLLELDKSILDKDLKKAYRKIVLRIHPDKLKLQSGEEAFKVLNAAYRQAEL